MPIIGAITGASGAVKTLGRAQGRVSGDLTSLARQGIEVSDEMIQRELDITIAQERRATETEARVRGIAGSASNISAAAPASAGYTEELASLVKITEGISASLANLFGGSAR